MDIDERYSRALDRRSSAIDRLVGLIKEVSEDVVGKYIRYAVVAMAPVASYYTDQLVDQGNRVENALSGSLRVLGHSVTFRRQGSVTNNTHIRRASDVDVLVVLETFYWVESPLKIQSEYSGDWKSDFLKLREDAKKTLNTSFPAANVDDSRSTALKMSGGSLKCDVDIVPSAWSDTERYRDTNIETYRGIRVFDKHKKTTFCNFPFLFNYRLLQKDEARQGGSKALIRLLKTLVSDISHEQDYSWSLSSYDICSIVYRMESMYEYNSRQPISLMYGLYKWLEKLVDDQITRESLLVIDDTRRIFDTDEKYSDLKKLFIDIRSLIGFAVNEAGYDWVTGVHLGKN